MYNEILFKTGKTKMKFHINKDMKKSIALNFLE